jgi:hypothetical protein
MNRAPRHWIWLILMVAATAWYAWPQLLYSLIPVYEIMRFFFPDLAGGLQPWVETIRGRMGG